MLARFLLLACFVSYSSAQGLKFNFNGLPKIQPTQTPSNFPPVVTVGGVFSETKYGDHFNAVISKCNTDNSFKIPQVHVNGTFILMDANPIRSAKSICDNLLSHKVSVVIASHPPNTGGPPLAVSFTCGYYKIPIIGISARESAFSDKNVHGYFLRSVAPLANQAEVWAELLVHFKFTKVIFVYTDDAEGRAMQGHFQSAVEDKNIEIEKALALHAEIRDYTEPLSKIKLVVSRVIVLFTDSSHAKQVYQDALQLGLFDEGYIWIVTEQALQPDNTPLGVIGLKHQFSTDEDRHINDTIEVIFMALKEMKAKNETLGSPPSSCTERSDTFKDGKNLLKYLKQQVIKSGATGHVAFDEAGDRKHERYEILNKQRDGPEQVRIGEFHAGKLTITFTELILWPGNTYVKPKGVTVQTNLRVVTIKEIPFVYTMPKTDAGGACDLNKGEVFCPHNNTNGTYQEYCCRGYIIDLMLNLSEKLNITCNVHLVGDGQYGSYEYIKGSSEKRWTGLIGELRDKKADLIIAPLTINPERAEVIDFTKPFKYQGLTVMVVKRAKDSSLDSFLQPFQMPLWILVGVSVHVVALVLYLLDRFSPFGRYKLAKNEDTEEDALNLSGAVWFAWGVLLNSGIGEGTPRSFSARVLGMVWAGFAMIIVASYTANLAAFLVLDRPEASISGIDDARLRNPQEAFRYATVKNSAVSMYFKRQVELSAMYRTMEPRNRDTPEDAIQALKNGDLEAFIWDSSRLEYEAANDCHLVTAGELFGRSGYGIGLEKNSAWNDEISLEIMHFHESGFMERLDNKWILFKDMKCPERDPSPATLGLPNMAGVFMMVAGGIVMGVFLIFVEILYKRHRGFKEKELKSARNMGERWRANVEKRRTLRKTLQQANGANGTNGDETALTLRPLLETNCNRH